MKLKIIFAKFVVFVVAFQILNISIYAQDYNPIKTSKTLYEINEINSVMEYVGEVLLHHNNQFPEYPNDGHRDMQFLKHVTLTVFSFPVLVQSKGYNNNVDYVAPVNEDYHFLFFKEINPPPPKTNII